MPTPTPSRSKPCRSSSAAAAAPPPGSAGASLAPPPGAFSLPPTFPGLGGGGPKLPGLGGGFSRSEARRSEPVSRRAGVCCRATVALGRSRPRSPVITASDKKSVAFLWRGVADTRYGTAMAARWLVIVGHKTIRGMRPFAIVAKAERARAAAGGGPSFPAKAVPRRRNQLFASRERRARPRRYATEAALARSLCLSRLVARRPTAISFIALANSTSIAVASRLVATLEVVPIAPRPRIRRCSGIAPRPSSRRKRSPKEEN